MQMAHDALLYMPLDIILYVLTNRFSCGQVFLYVIFFFSTSVADATTILAHLSPIMIAGVFFLASVVELILLTMWPGKLLSLGNFWTL